MVELTEHGNCGLTYNVGMRGYTTSTALAPQQKTELIVKKGNLTVVIILYARGLCQRIREKSEHPELEQ